SFFLNNSSVRNAGRAFQVFSTTETHFSSSNFGGLVSREIPKLSPSRNAASRRRGPWATRSIFSSADGLAFCQILNSDANSNGEYSPSSAIRRIRGVSVLDTGWLATSFRIMLIRSDTDLD